MVGGAHCASAQSRKANRQSPTTIGGASMFKSHSALLAALSVLCILWQAAAAAGVAHHHYKLIDIGTFPGRSIYNRPVTSNESTPPEFEQALNNQGTLIGGADTPLENPNSNCYNPFNISSLCYIDQAFVWRNGQLTNLGALPGGNNSFPYYLSDNGLIAGGSEIGTNDPVSGLPESHAVLWSNGTINDLGTLGGTLSLAVGVNDAGQVVGGSLDANGDNRAFLWQSGVMQDLGTLGGANAFAAYVNNNGQIAGVADTSYTADPNTGSPPQDPFLWQHGHMTDLGNFGGGTVAIYGLNNRGEVTGSMTLAGDVIDHAFLWNGARLIDLNVPGGGLGGSWSYPSGLNDAGEVVGVAALPGDQTNHAFLWTNGVMKDLGTLHGDPCSGADKINSRGQVVGASKSTRGGCYEGTSAFLWEDGGPIVDLNTLLSSPSTMLLAEAYWINDAGEITGRAVPAGCGDDSVCGHAFLLIPCDANHLNIAGCDYSSVDAASAAALSQQSTAVDAVAADQAALSPAKMTVRNQTLMTNRYRWWSRTQQR